MNLLRNSNPHPDDLIYTAISSKIICPNSPYNISLFVEDNKSPAAPNLLLFTATIHSRSNSEKWSSQEIWLKPSQHAILPILVPQLTKVKYTLTLKVKSEGGKSDGRKREWEDVRSIFVTRKERSILVHTDKPVYKPGETVKFRVVLLNIDLKPFLDQQLVHVKIFDPEGNTIKIWEDCQVQQGLFKAELELSNEPIIGDWMLEVRGNKPNQGVEQPVQIEKKGEDEDSEEEEEEEIQEIVQRLNFSVEKYVLPKFQVSLKPPPFLTFDQVIVPIQVEARYTYGKGVTGQFTVTPKRDYYWNQEKPKITSVTGKLDGVSIVDVDIKGIFQPEEMRYDGQVQFEVTVKEDQTNKEMSTCVSVPVHRYPYKIETIINSSFVKPGLPFTVGFKVTTQDNIPITDPSLDALTIHHGFSYLKETNKILSHIPPNGTIFLNFDTPTNELNRPERIEVQYKELTHIFYVPQNYDSRLKSYIDMKILNDDLHDGPKVQAGSNIEVNVSTTKEFTSLNYILHGRMEVLSSGNVQLPEKSKTTNFTLHCPERGKPEVTLIVYIVLDDTKDVIADSKTISVSSSTSSEHFSADNFLSISLSDEKREPGESLTLNMKTRENSVVALRGVDQSILLLNKPDNDINQDSIDQMVRERNQESNQIRRVWGGSSSFQLFEQVGLLILTNARIEMERWHAPPRYRGGGGIRHKKMMAAPQAALFGAAGDRVMNMERGHFALGGHTGGQREVRVRSQFAETFIWEDIQVSNGSASLTKIVPDTLTSWYITGYSLNDYGLGALSDPLKLTVFRPFFLTLNLPYSVVKGEVLSLQVLVHNYIPNNSNPITASITLENNLNQFQLAGEEQSQRTVSCEANSVTSVYFTIIPQEFGSILLNVKGLTDVAGDAVSQPLRVKPPGEERRNCVSALLTAGAGPTAGENEVKLGTLFPKDRVSGADSIKMTIISDIIGSSIANLDKLIQLPVGCGEQNMLNFVADIVILNYLQASHRLTSSIKMKALKFLQTGYQQQLTYRHSNGSYSAFGPSDPNGSTWLTAFVTKSFIRAKSYITIDDQVILKALKFLSSQQDGDSCSFGECGKVIHSEMQGGSASNSLSLTAYTLLTFLEASRHFKEEETIALCTKVIERAVKYLAKTAKLVDKIHDHYALVLTTHALHEAKYEDIEQFFELLTTLAVKDGGLVHWENRKEEQIKDPKICETKTARHYPWEFRKSVSVEMTAYALLTNLMRGQVSQSTPIVRWLLMQRNSCGGFVSTQDTVVGLTALAKFAELTKETNKDLIVKSTVHGEELPVEVKEVSINEKNSDLLQEFLLPSTTNSVHFEAVGSGSVLTQLDWSYYVEDTVHNPAFSIDIKVENRESGILLEIRTALLHGEESNMAIIEVNLPSGYAVDRDFLEENVKEENVKGYKRREIQNLDTKLEIYFESLDKSGVTVQVLAMKQFNIGKVAKASVNVYDYYEPMRRARDLYEPPCPLE